MVCGVALLTLYLLGCWQWVGCPTSLRAALRPHTDEKWEGVPLGFAAMVFWPMVLLVYFLITLGRGIVINAARLVRWGHGPS